MSGHQVIHTVVHGVLSLPQEIPVHVSSDKDGWDIAVVVSACLGPVIAIVAAGLAGWLGWLTQQLVIKTAELNQTTKDVDENNRNFQIGRVTKGFELDLQRLSRLFFDLTQPVKHKDFPIDEIVDIVRWMNQKFETYEVQIHLEDAYYEALYELMHPLQDMTESMKFLQQERWNEGEAKIKMGTSKQIVIIMTYQAKLCKEIQKVFHQFRKAFILFNTDILKNNLDTLEHNIGVCISFIEGNPSNAQSTTEETNPNSPT